jgi:para-aminobenzoate synthetase/4-amino-4-deoxychorismate lyase
VTTVFALLDDAQASAEDPRSRLYTGYAHQHIGHDTASLTSVWAAVAADLAAGLHAVLLADYAWGVRLQGLTLAPDHPPGALRFLMFRALTHCSCVQVEAWLAAQAPSLAEPPWPVAWSPEVSEALFTERIERIHALIRAGETYQVNHTFGLQAEMEDLGDAGVGLYRCLRQRQPVPFGALIVEPDQSVLSFSPELFVRHHAGRLSTKPMKGTAARYLNDPERDAAAAAWLERDPKNRAENLMITDLLRNDLGRLARVGSVRVPQLFQVEAHGALWQMTSTVEAEPLPGTDLPAVLRALFPCGSITGAPKHHTMQLIQTLEDGARGLYTGAIGWVDAPLPGQSLAEFCLSVAIRTVVVGAATASAEGGPLRRPARLGVGAGIVLDSVASDEWRECQIKAGFVRPPWPKDVAGVDGGSFRLFETLRVEADGSVPHLDAHFERLSRSAAAFGWPVPQPHHRAALQAHAAGLKGQGHVHRLRWDWSGDVGCDVGLDDPLRLSGGPLSTVLPEVVDLLLSPEPLPAVEAAWVGHKTSHRASYDAAIRAAEAQGAFDTLFFNAQGELTEGARSSVFVKLDGIWTTPPLRCGLLPGVMRAHLLADASLAMVERVLTRADLARAEAVWVGNALRGVLPARIRHVDPVAQVQQALVHAHQSGACLDPKAFRGLLGSAAQAEAVQHGVGLTLGWWDEGSAAAFWKSGGARFDTISHAPLPPRGSAPWHAPGVEAEIAFRLGRDVDATLAATLDQAAAEALMDAIAVSIEVVDSRWRDPAQAEPWLRVADGQSHAALVLGPWRPLAPQHDWSQQSCTVQMVGRMGRHRAAAQGRHALGHPAAVLPVWLRHATQGFHGETRVVRAGTVVTTGSWVGTLPVQRGDTVEVDFAGLGRAVWCWSDPA